MNDLRKLTWFTTSAASQLNICGISKSHFLISAAIWWWSLAPWTGNYKTNIDKKKWNQLVYGRMLRLADTNLQILKILLKNSYYIWGHQFLGWHIFINFKVLKRILWILWNINKAQTNCLYVSRDEHYWDLPLKCEWMGALLQVPYLPIINIADVSE